MIYDENGSKIINQKMEYINTKSHILQIVVIRGISVFVNLLF